MGDTENTTEPQEVTIEAVPKKPRSEAQLAALEAARQKAYAIRAEKSAQKKSEEASVALAQVEAQKKALLPKVEVKIEDEEEEEPEVIYRKKPPKKKKRIVVVQEEESSDSEIEVRLPKAKQQPPITKPKTSDEIRYEKAYNRLFSVDTL